MTKEITNMEIIEDTPWVINKIVKSELPHHVKLESVTRLSSNIVKLLEMGND
jgi:hypothetical protein